MRTIIYRYTLWLAISLSGVMVACSDDEFDRASFGSDGLYFEISTSARTAVGDTKTTRASEPVSEGLTDFNSRQFDNSPLYLHSYTEDGIDGAAFAVEGAHTRALPEVITTENFKEKYGSFTLYTAQSAYTDFTIKGEKILLVKDGTSLKAHLGHPWPSGKDVSMRFFAFAPDDVTYGGYVNDGNTGLLMIKDTVPETVDKHYDLLGAYKEETSKPSDNRISLAFNHLFACVKVVFADGITPNQVTSVKFHNIKNSGSYTFREYGNSYWTLNDKELKTIYWTSSMSDLKTQKDTITFMMMPQSLGNNARVEVTLNGVTKSLTASLQGENWGMGKTRTYKVSKSSIESVFEVDMDTVFTYQGNDNANLKVKSYNKNGYSGLGWTLQYYSVEEEQWVDTNPASAWLTDLPSSGNGDYYGNSFPYAVAAQEKKATITAKSHDEILKNRNVVTDYDLSTKGGSTSMNTANCYIVNAPGTYNLPLVYGNAIKNGATNESAYKSTATGKNILEVFKNHLGNDITDPYITNNTSCEAKDACLVWQDEKNLVTNVKLKDGKLQFKVKQDSIKVGNAVVAVRDNNGNIMWSWHIWVTDYELGKDDITVTNKDTIPYQFMAQNIGCCSPTTTSYEGRQVKVKFTQTDTGKEIIVTVVQSPATILDDPGNQPYFQWGRKDPMPPYNAGKDKIAEGNFEESKYSQTLGWSIQHPNTYISSGSNWTSENSYMNLWHIDNTAYGSSQNAKNDIGVKTIYDPSPAGYCVPPSGAFTGFTCGEFREKKSFDEINSPFTQFEDALETKGWLFYCKPMQEEEISGEETVWIKDETSGTIHFAGTGYRFYNSKKVEYYNNATWCWSSIPTAATKANLLYAAYYQYNKDYRVNTLFSAEKTYGCIIRPVRDE